MTVLDITSNPPQDKAGSKFGDVSWSSQYPPVPIQSTAPHQHVASRVVPSTSGTWYDPLRQVPPPFQQTNHSASNAAGSLHSLPAQYAPRRILNGSYLMTNLVASRNPLNVEDDDQMSGGKRIRIACDACRKKKTKCDGHSPCSICKALTKQGACIYAERPMKRNGKSSKPNGAKRSKLKDAAPIETVADSIDTRLSNLENVLLRLAQKLDVGELLSSETLQNSFHSTLTEKDSDHDYDSPTSSPREHYFGPHCLITVLSDNSLDEIDNIVGRANDEHITLPIRNMPIVFAGQCKSFLLRWIDPPVIDHRRRRELFTRPFPPDSQLVYDLIDHYYIETAIISVVFPSATIRALFEDYYKNPELEPSKRRQFKLSDFLIMTSSLLMSLTSKIDKDAFSADSRKEPSTADSAPSNPDQPHSRASPASATPLLLQNISNEDLIKMKNNLFDNAIFYYHRLSVISDGLETIKAIVHLMVYNETNWFTSHVNYILCAIVVRFAQDIGLHKIETYEGLSIKDRMDRLQVWWLINFFDIDICFRTGKPPLINIADVTVNEDEEVKVYCKMIVPQHLNLHDSSEPVIDLLESIEVHDVQFYRVYQAMLTKIRTKSYNQLFVSVSKDLSFAKLAARLDTLNSDMAVLAEKLPEHDRPRFFKDPDFHFIEYPNNVLQRDTVLMIHFTYLVHIMSINRLPYIMVKAGAATNFQESLRFKNIALDAARTVLVLVQQVKKEHTGLSFYNWLILSAFLTIVSAVLDFPELSETESDLRLLVHTSMHFFGKQSRWREDQPDLAIFLQIDTLLGVLVKVMLRAVVKFYEVKLDVSYVDLYPGLRDHLDSAKKEFPMVFEETGEFQLKLQLVLADRARSLSKRGSELDIRGIKNVKSASESQSIIRYIVETLTRRENNMIENKTGTTDNDLKYDELMIGMLKQQIQEKQQQEVPADLTQPQYVPCITDSFAQDTPVGYDNPNAEMFNDFVNEDDISLMFYSQMVNLPSFFYENKLQ